MATPAIAPVESCAPDSAVEDGGADVVGAPVGVVVADGAPPLVCCGPVLFPAGWRFTYAAQSGYFSVVSCKSMPVEPWEGLLEVLTLGAASGHSGAWQSEKSWPLTAGAQRTLYREFMKVSSVEASVSEKP